MTPLDRDQPDGPTALRASWPTFLLAPLPLLAGLVASYLARDLTVTVLAVLLGGVVILDIGRTRVRAGSISGRTAGLTCLGAAMLVLAPFVAFAVWVWMYGLPIISDPAR